MITIAAKQENGSLVPSEPLPEGETIFNGTHYMIRESYDDADFLQLLSELEAAQEETLDQMKVRRKSEIDSKTDALISNGFAFDSHHFSLSLKAQSNWTNIKANKQDFIDLGLFPLAITSAEGEYLLSESNVFSFWITAMGTVKAHYGSGLALKSQIDAAATKEEVDAVVDNR